MNTPERGDRRRKIGPEAGVGIAISAVAAMVATGLAILFSRYQSWEDLSSGQATLLASGAAVIAASIALWGAWITRRGVQFERAHMRRVDLSGAMLNYAFFKNCDLGEAVIAERTDFTGISYDAATIWPDGFVPPRSRVEITAES